MTSTYIMIFLFLVLLYVCTGLIMAIWILQPKVILPLKVGCLKKFSICFITVSINSVLTSILFIKAVNLTRVLICGKFVLFRQECFALVFSCLVLAHLPCYLHNFRYTVWLSQWGLLSSNRRFEPSHSTSSSPSKWELWFQHQFAHVALPLKLSRIDSKECWRLDWRSVIFELMNFVKNCSFDPWQ